MCFVANTERPIHPVDDHVEVVHVLDSEKRQTIVAVVHHDLAVEDGDDHDPQKKLIYH